MFGHALQIGITWAIDALRVGERFGEIGLAKPRNSSSLNSSRLFLASDRIAGFNSSLGSADLGGNDFFAFVNCARIASITPLLFLGRSDSQRSSMVRRTRRNCW